MTHANSATPDTVCKCCGAATAHFGSYDLSRTCEDYKAPVFTKANVGVPYLRCISCQFIFTTFFDCWSKEEFAEQIYNSDYILADPDFIIVRPKYFADVIDKMLGSMKSKLKVLDYGGGAGKLKDELQNCGFEYCETFDPFFGSEPRPTTLFDLITAFEVIEHTTNPIGTFQDTLSHLGPSGVLLFSTALQNRKVERDWWYVAPRNGHVSIYSGASLRHLARLNDVKCLSLDDGLHIFYKAPPSQLMRKIAETRRSSALYAASKRGWRSFYDTARIFSELGFRMNLRDLNHLRRSILRTLGF